MNPTLNPSNPSPARQTHLWVVGDGWVALLRHVEALTHEPNP